MLVAVKKEMTKGRVIILWSVLVFGIVAAVVLGWRANRFVPQETTDLREAEDLTASRPALEWQSYGKLASEIRRWVQSFRWVITRPGGEDAQPPGETGEFSPSLVRVRALFQAELAERQALFEEAVKRREEQMKLEIEGKVELKRNQARALLQEAIAAKKREQAKELNDFQEKKEKDYSLKLISLYFKAEIPDLSPEERSLLAEERSALEAKLAAEIEAKRQELAEELEAFTAQQKLMAEEELVIYRQSLEREGQKRFLEEKDQLEQEFSEWKAKRQSELGLSAETAG